MQNAIKIICMLVVVGVVLFAFLMPNDSKPAAEETHETMAIIIAQGKVKQQLKSPSTADFEMFNGQAEHKGNGDYVVRDHVDSQNGFGATVRSEYLVEMHFDGGDNSDPNSWTVTKMQIE